MYLHFYAKKHIIFLKQSISAAPLFTVCLNALF